MSITGVPSSERVTISFFGLTNSGKSSVVNMITNQEISIVSDIKGTTTDPVRKTMEILPIGPVNIIDTPGYDDFSDLGKERVKRTLKVLDETDIAVLVSDMSREFTVFEENLIKEFEKRNISFIIAINKSDLERINKKVGIKVSALKKEGKDELINAISNLYTKKEKKIISPYIKRYSTVILVIPIDEASPKDRIILPQQLVLKELLEYDCTCVCVKEVNLKKTLSLLKEKPDLVITDSQVFGYVSKIIASDVLLTSFSILLANYKGDFDLLLKGCEKLDDLKDGDKILISEGCTHHRQCNDIGKVKIPNLVRKYTKKNLNFEFTSGKDFPDCLKNYSLIIHCGGCMLGDKEMTQRIKRAENEGVPIVNYGMTIAKINGVLKRSTEIFKNE